MDSRDFMCLMVGVFAATSCLCIAEPTQENGSEPPLPSVERTLADLAAFHIPTLESDSSADGLLAHPLDPFLEPPPTGACDDGFSSYPDVVVDVARTLHAQRIPYRSDLLADCSGMMHRVLQAAAGRCRDVARPTVRHARRARELARWYEARGTLARVHTPQDIDAALSVGAMAFFLAPGRQQGGLENIFHIGIITEIHRDDLGRVQSYEMFHGRRPGVTASITRWHRRHRVPALGNGTERMIAVAWPFPNRPSIGDTEAAGDGMADASSPESAHTL